jgi:hypothetical protein
VNLASFRKPKATYFLSYGEDRPSTNISKIYIFIEIQTEHVSKRGTGRVGQERKKRRKDSK